ncbi:hypothetical protein [Thermotoga sp. Ku-13t]|uniref:hypothetical protein n=1 Tax=Thermotoga sp. Ku-13t TaxID=1755813 RepID=UPI001F493B16|nr:hypothetical protein [Thermotoga sp. Ku-13t]
MKTFWKILIYMVLFSVFHFGYELTGWNFLRILCGTDESVFEHLKMGFWAYFFASIIEFNIAKKGENFWPSRLFSTILVPWFIVIVWYMVPAISGKLESLALELIWAFVVIISGLFAIVLERQLEAVRVSRSFNTILAILFIVSLVFFVRFSLTKPLIDLFVDPSKL